MDSGSLDPTLPYASNSSGFFPRTAFENYQGDVAYPSPCEEIPWDLTLDFEMRGKEREKVMVKLPYRYLARGSPGPGGVMPEDKCILNMVFSSGYVFGAPWFMDASVGVDDGEGLIWVAQGRL